MIQSSKVCMPAVLLRLRSCATLLVGLLLALCCRGQDDEDAAPHPAAPVAQGTPASATDRAGVTATATNAAVSRARLRDPFWPPDYVPPVLPGEKTDNRDAAKISESEWRAVERMLRDAVKGVSRIPGKKGKDETLAVINDKVVAVGELVSLSANGKNYRWKVVRIAVPGGPVFERVAVTPASSAPPK